MSNQMYVLFILDDLMNRWFVANLDDGTLYDEQGLAPVGAHCFPYYFADEDEAVEYAVKAERVFSTKKTKVIVEVYRA